jgi:hypothetical protein
MFKGRNHVRRVTSMTLADRTVHEALRGTPFRLHPNPARTAFTRMGKDLKPETTEPQYVIQMFHRDTGSYAGNVCIHKVYLRVRFGRQKMETPDEYRIHADETFASVIAQIYEVVRFAAMQRMKHPVKFTPIATPGSDPIDVPESVRDLTWP